MRGDRRRTSWYLAASRFVTHCTGPRCRKQMTFYTNARTGKKMPFTGMPRVLNTGTVEDPERPGTWHQTVELDLADAHHITCPHAPAFSRKAKR